MRIANIEEYIEQIKKEDIVQETEVRSKIVNPLLDLLRYPTENIAEEYPVYGKDGRKDLNTKSADIMIFKDSNANMHRDKKETGWVMNNSLVVFELKKPKEKIENAKDQATFYAMWTRCIVYVITNGNDIEIYKLKEYNADKLLFKDKVINLVDSWSDLSIILDYNNLIKMKEKDKTVTLNNFPKNTQWESVSFDVKRDITDAIIGNKLFPYNVKSCPELPIIKKIEENLELLNYSIIRGIAGSGKSITAYQVAYHFYMKGWRVFKYINKNEFFDYNFKKITSENSIFIIDDLQNIQNVYIEKVIANTSENVKVICTITDEININAETTYISNTESIEKIKHEYLQNKKKIYEIVHKIDKNIGDSYFSETIERRIEKAAKEATTPWMFNYILRGGWNIAKEDFLRLREKNRADWIILFLAMKQIAMLDKSVTKEELKRVLDFLEYDINWFKKNLKYMLDNKLIIIEDEQYRCIHIQYASIIIFKFTDNCEEKDRDILIKIIRSIIENENTPIQGISWLLNEFRSTVCSLYYQRNIITSEIWKKIENRCINSNNDIDIRNSCFLFDTLIRFYDNAKKDIINKHLPLLAKWIEEVNHNTGYALSWLVNSILDYREKNSDINNKFEQLIDFKKLAKNINKSSYNDLGAMGKVLNRFFVFKDQKWKEDIINNINIQLLKEKIRSNKYKIDVYELSEFIVSMYYINAKIGIELYEVSEDVFTYNIKKSPLSSYEEMQEHLLWMIFVYSMLDHKSPKKEYKGKAKILVKAIDAKLVASEICSSNRHDWERYARFIDWINRVDKSKTREIVKYIDYARINNNFNDYWREPPSEMKLLLVSLAESTKNHEPIKTWINDNIEKVEIADPLLTYLEPQLAIKCFEAKQKIDIFGHNDSEGLAFLMLNILNEQNSNIAINAIKDSKQKIQSKINNIIPYNGCYDLDWVNFIELIYNIDKLAIKEIFEDMDEIKAKECWTRYKNDAITMELSNRKFAYRTLYTICKYTIKYNKKLKKFCEDLVKEIPKIYQK